MIEPSGWNPYVVVPKTHCGAPNSASIGRIGSTFPSRLAYRFHQFVRSETKYSVPSGDQLGWKIDSSAPPATFRGLPSEPSPLSGATNSSVPSHGIFG